MFVNHVLRQVAARAVVSAELAGRVVLVGVAEAAVGVAIRDELFRIFFIKIHALALDIRAAVAAVARTLVRHDAGGRERALDDVDGVRDVARAVRVLDAQDEVAAVRLGEQVSVERRAQVADVHVARRTRREARAYFLVGQYGFLLKSKDVIKKQISYHYSAGAKGGQVRMARRRLRALMHFFEKNLQDDAEKRIISSYVLRSIIEML